MGIPNEKARLKIFEVMCRGANFEDGFDFGQLARLTPGFVGSDLKALLKAAAMRAVERRTAAAEEVYREAKKDAAKGAVKAEDVFRWLDSTPVQRLQLQMKCPAKLAFADFESALKSVRPSAMREGFATVPDCTFEDIGALEDIRDELEMAICVPVQYPEVAASLGLDSPSGVLLCGPPGCGKTLLAKAVANQAGINFISVKGPEIMNMVSTLIGLSR